MYSGRRLPFISSGSPRGTSLQVEHLLPLPESPIRPGLPLWWRCSYVQVISPHFLFLSSTARSVRLTLGWARGFTKFIIIIINSSCRKRAFLLLRILLFGHHHHTRRRHLATIPFTELPGPITNLGLSGRQLPLRFVRQKGEGSKVP